MLDRPTTAIDDHDRWIGDDTMNRARELVAAQLVAPETGNTRDERVDAHKQPYMAWLKAHTLGVRDHER